MAQKSLREFDSKTLLSKWVPTYTNNAFSVSDKFVQVYCDGLRARTTSHGSQLADDVADDGALPTVQEGSTTPRNTTGKYKSLLSAAEDHPWLNTEKLVVKVDQLIKRRGKAGLLLLNASLGEANAWIEAHSRSTVCEPLKRVCGRECSYARQRGVLRAAYSGLTCGLRCCVQVTVEGVTGTLSHFFVEPMQPHTQEQEHYASLYSDRTSDVIMFHHEGGVDVGDVDAKALKLHVPVGEEPTQDDLLNLVRNIPAETREAVAAFLAGLLKMYRDLHFTLLEINPLVVKDGNVYPLDVAAKIDEAAEFIAGPKWGSLDFPPPFGRQPWPEEAFIHDLDSRTGASLKLTLLNRKGRVWTMVAGGGASVVYADTISDLGFGGELANYGEYSGAPTEDQTFQYARTILKLMTAEPHESGRGKVLIVGGGIANFTDVAKTFRGIIRAFKVYAKQLQSVGATVWVRRGGPNYQEGLQHMRDTGAEIGVPIHVYGPDTHMTAVVPMALGLPVDPELMGAFETRKGIDTSAGDVAEGTPAVAPTAGAGAGAGNGAAAAAAAAGAGTAATAGAAGTAEPEGTYFTPATRAIVHGMQLRAVQGMLDFDYLSGRKEPSVAAIHFPFAGNHYQKFYMGNREVLIPVYVPVTAVRCVRAACG